MRWPWQSVTVADVVERRRVGEATRFEAQIADLKAALALADTRYDDLLDKYHALRGGGAAIPAVLSEPSVVDEAIDEMARRFGNSTRLRRVLQDYARKAKLKGTDDEAIAAGIRDWRRPDDEAEAS